MSIHNKYVVKQDIFIAAETAHTYIYGYFFMKRCVYA